MKINLEHTRSLPCITGSGYCAKGIRHWADLYGFNWQEFIHEGVEEELVLATGNAMAIRVVEWAHKLEEHKLKQKLGDGGSEG